MQGLSNERDRECYHCHFSKQAIAIDGDFDKPVWRKSSPIRFYIPGTGQAPESKTEAGLLWDENYLYVCFKAYDKDIFAYHTERDSSTCRDDVLEVFFKTESSKEHYYNFEINALNTVYDAHNLRRNTAGGHHRWKRWNCNGLKSCVTIKGSLNHPYDIDEYWQLELAIPFRELDLGGKEQPETGDKWLFSLCRYDYSVYLEEGVELSSSSRLTVADFHKWEDWNDLEFVGF